ncbi:MAG: DUF2284 domain-containing protein [Rikenellaceae bacterium]
MSKIEEISAVIKVSEYIEKYRNVEHFFGFCRECNGYGKTWACPPYESEISLDEYTYANIYGRKIVVEPSLRVTMSGEELKRAMAAILEPVRRSLDLQLLELERLNPNSRALFAGSCRSCPEGECTRPVNKPCVKPHMMRPSLEAMGFDVGRTASELLGIELQWSSDTLPEYFTLVYALFSKEQINKSIQP